MHTKNAQAARLQQTMSRKVAATKSHKVAATKSHKVAANKSRKAAATKSSKTNLHKKNSQAATMPQLAAAAKSHACCLFAAILCNKPFISIRVSDSLKFLVGQKRKMKDKNNRVLLYSNTSLSKFRKHCKFDAKLSKYRGNIICAIFIHWRPSHPKYCMGIFLDYNFLLDKLSGKLTKFAGHFRNLPVLSNRPTVFARLFFKN